MNKVVNINGEKIQAKLFKTCEARDRYMAKNPQSRVLFTKAHYYLVSR